MEALIYLAILIISVTGLGFAISTIAMVLFNFSEDRPVAPAPNKTAPAVQPNLKKIVTGQKSGRNAILDRLLAINAPESSEAGTIRRLHSLEDHQAALRSAFVQAKERVVIVSPFISAGAIKADNVESLIRDAVGRGVEVDIFTDRTLNVDTDGSEKPASREGRLILERSGATVFLVERAHNKTLCIDNTSIIDGSFNWLSALRDKAHRHQRAERSMMLIGGGAGKMIAKEMDSIARSALRSLAA